MGEIFPVQILLVGMKADLKDDEATLQELSKKEQVILVVNKAKAISAELLELSLKNKLEETGKTR